MGFIQDFKFFFGGRGGGGGGDSDIRVYIIVPYKNILLPKSFFWGGGARVCN